MQFASLSLVRSVGAVAGLCLASLACAQDYWVPVNMLPWANDRLQNRSAAYPSTSILLGGVPFRIEPTGNNIWAANLAPGNNPRVIEVPINIAGVREVHTLINTDWGQANAPSRARIEFIGTGGAFHAVDLIGNVDIRDWTQNTFTNAINNASTTQVFASGNARLDKQRIVLPVSFATQDLLRVRFIDTGATNQQRMFVSGLSILINQPAPVVFPAAFGGSGQRFQAVQALQGINWADAQAACVLRGGTLATLTSAAEMNAAYALVGGNQAFWWQSNATNTYNSFGPWIGGRQAPGAAEPLGGWQWVTGEPFAFSNWASGEPNNAPGIGNEDRLQFLGTNIPASNRWNDNPAATLHRGYILELPPCPGDIASPGPAQGGDGERTADDVILFINWFTSSNPLADIAGPGPSVGPDGEFTADDVILFINRFSAPCD